MADGYVKIVYSYLSSLVLSPTSVYTSSIDSMLVVAFFVQNEEIKIFCVYVQNGL